MLSFVNHGDSYIKVTGILVGNLKGRPIWVWLKLKLTTYVRPKSTIYTPNREDEHPVTSIRDPPPPPPPPPGFVPGPHD